MSHCCCNKTKLPIAVEVGGCAATLSQMTIDGINPSVENLVYSVSDTVQENMELGSTVCIFCKQDEDTNKDVESILRGVEVIKLKESVPCFLTVDGETSFPFLVGQAETTRMPIAAASYYGKGRIVVSAHTSMFLDDARDGIRHGNNVLILNSVNWATTKKQNVKGALPKGSWDESHFLSLFCKNGISAETIDQNKLADACYLKQFDFLLLNKVQGEIISREMLVAIQSFVSGGGALLLGGTGWSYYPPEGETHRTSYFGNRVLQYLGSEIQFIPWYAYKTTPDGYSTSRHLLLDTHSNIAWKKLEKIVDYELLIQLSEDKVRQITNIVKTQLMFGVKDLNKKDIQKYLSKLIQLKYSCQ